MLLDEKRTRFWVRVVSSVAALAFVGVLPVVIISLLASGGSSQASAVSDALKLTRQTPTSADAWDQLATAYQSDTKLPQALAAAQRATSLAPHNLDYLNTQVGILLQQADLAAVIQKLQGFTRANPRNPDAFLELGEYADRAKKTGLAVLAFSTFLRLDPYAAEAAAVRGRIRTLTHPGTSTTGSSTSTTGTPTATTGTSTGPATPATP